MLQLENRKKQANLSYTCSDFGCRSNASFPDRHEATCRIMQLDRTHAPIACMHVRVKHQHMPKWLMTEQRPWHGRMAA